MIRFASLFILVFFTSCKLGPGKFPNPQWIPEVERTVLFEGERAFRAADLDFRITRTTWICTQYYELVRIPTREDYEFELEGFVTDPGGGHLYGVFPELDLKILDADGERIPGKARFLHGPREADPGPGLRAFRGLFEFTSDERLPAFLVVDGTVVDLRP